MNDSSKQRQEFFDGMRFLNKKDTPEAAMAKLLAAGVPQEAADSMVKIMFPSPKQLAMERAYKIWLDHQPVQSLGTISVEFSVWAAAHSHEFE